VKPLPIIKLDKLNEQAIRCMDHNLLLYLPKPSKQLSFGLSFIGTQVNTTFHIGDEPLFIIMHAIWIPRKFAPAAIA